MKIFELLGNRTERVKNEGKTNINKKIDNKLAVLEDSKNEIQNRLDIENHNLLNVEQILELLRNMVI